MKEPIKVYCARKGSELKQLELSDAEWDLLGEIEGVLNVTVVTTTLVQEEQAFTGAFPSLVKGLTLRSLRGPTGMRLPVAPEAHVHMYRMTCHVYLIT